MGWFLAVAYVAVSIYSYIRSRKAQKELLADRRLGEIYYGSAAYGVERPVGFGTCRIPGNMVWSIGIQENPYEEDGVQKFDYRGTWAVAFGEGIAEDVLRLWMDGKLVYTTDGQKDLGVSGELRKNGNFRFYGGTEDQLPDPRIEAVEGAGETPAFRGTCYIVFDDVPLKDFGDGFPRDVSAELAYVSESSSPTETTDLLTPAEGGRLDGFSQDVLAVDHDRRFAYLIDNTGTGDSLDDTGIRKVNLDTMEEVLQVTLRESGIADHASSVGAVVACVTPAGDLVLAPGSGNSRPIVVLDKDTLRVKTYFGEENAETTWHEPSANYPYGSAPYAWYGGLTTLSRIREGARQDFILVGTGFGSFGLLYVQSPRMRLVWNSDDAGYAVDGARIHGVASGAVGDDVGDAYVIAGPVYPSSGQLVVHRVRVTEFMTVTATRLGDVSPAEFFPAYGAYPAASSLSDAGAGFNYFTKDGVWTDEFLVFQGMTTTTYFGYTGVFVSWMILGLPSAEVPYLWIANRYTFATSDSRILSSQNVLANSRCSPGRTLGYVVRVSPTQGRAYVLNLNRNAGPGNENYLRVPGTVDLPDCPYLVDGVLFDLSPGAYGAGSWDSSRGIFVGTDEAGGGAALWHLGRRVGGEAPLDGIVEALAARVGILSADLDLAAVAAITVPGLPIVRQTTARDVLRDLCTVFFVDPVETDHVLRLSPRSDAVVREIAYEDLLDPGDDPPTKGTRADETGLPLTLSLSYLRKENRYLEGSQPAARSKASVRARGEQGISVSIVLWDEQAKRAVEALLYSTWAGSRSFSSGLGSRHLDLDPGDVVLLPTSSTESSVVRLDEVEVSDGYDITVGASSVGEGAHESEAEADGGATTDAEGLPTVDKIELALLDCPLLADTDEPEAGSSDQPAYYALGGYEDDGFPGGQLYRDRLFLDRSSVGMSWGAIIPDPVSHEYELLDPPGGRPHTTDEESAIRVAMYVGGAALASVTQEELYSGANRAAVLRDDGAVEIIAFRDVALVAQNIYLLTGLLRGRRGSETSATGHGDGEILVLLDDAVRLVGLAPPAAGVPVTLRGLAPGETLEEADFLYRFFYARSLMPYAPCQIRLAPSGAADVLFSWRRRTRVGGDLLSGTGEVPLSEDAEEYELRLLDWEGVVRRTEPLNAPSFLYTRYNQLGDGWDLRSLPPDRTVTAEVRQVSQRVVVGGKIKGFPGSATFRRAGGRYVAA